MEEESDTTTDHSLEGLVVGLVWKVAKLTARFLWNLALGILASVIAGLILLVGVSAVLGFGSLGLGLLLLLIKTAVSLVVAFVLSITVAVGALAALVRVSAFLASRRISIKGRWRWFRLPLKRLRLIVARLRIYSRTAPRDDQMVTLVGVVLVMATILLIAYLEIWGLKSWNQVRRAQLPTRIPVERVGRSSMPQILTVADAAQYTRTRRDKVAAMKRDLVQSDRGGNPVPSRCGSVLAPLPAETHQIAELFVDLTQAPPITKREYLLTEDQLTVALAALLRSRDAPVALDCVKLHRDSIKFFTTTVDRDGARQNQAFGMSVTKVAGRASILLEELSIGRGSFQLGWLEIGVTSDRKGFLSDGEGVEEIQDALRALDSRIFAINVNEGHIRIVTWRLPSLVTARAAESVGHVREAVEHRVEPNDVAASLGKVSATDLLYVLEKTDGWLYVCSEVSGRCGWLPDDAFVSLQDDLQFADYRSAVIENESFAKWQFGGLTFPCGREHG